MAVAFIKLGILAEEPIDKYELKQSYVSIQPTDERVFGQERV